MLYSLLYFSLKEISNFNPSQEARSELLFPSYSGLIDPSKNISILIKGGGNAVPLLTELMYESTTYLLNKY